MPERRRVLFLSPNVIGRRMAGVGARHLELARALAAAGDLDVSIAVARIDGEPPVDIPVVPIGRASRLPRLVAGADVLVLQGDFFRRYPGFRPPEGVPVVVDAACPNLLEEMESRRGRRSGEEDGLREESLEHDDLLRMAHHLLEIGDLFLCGSERQRDLVLGMLLALGRLNPATYADDPTFGRLVATVPHAVPDGEPSAAGPDPRAAIDGIGPDDLLLYWGGGVWNWLDPGTVVEAVGRVAERRPEVKLLFAGTENPDPDAPVHDVLPAAVARARAAGLEGRCVFFGSWVPYDERGAALRSADVGVSAHRSSVETRFAVRTRILDYLWAGLPVITTDGDDSADLVRRERLGEVVAPGDVDGWAAAIDRLAADARRREACGERSRAAGRGLGWSDAAAPLLAFCREPRPAADHRAGTTAGRVDAARRYGGKAIDLARRGRFDEILRGIRWQAKARWAGRGRAGAR